MKVQNNTSSARVRISAIILACVLAIGCLLLASCSTTSSQSAAGSSASSTATSGETSANAAPNRIVDESSGVSLLVPDGWESVAPSSDYPDIVKWVLTPKDKGAQAQMVFLTWDLYGDASDEELAGRTREDFNTRTFDEEYVLNSTRGSMVSTKSETASLVTLGGVEYWQTRIDGTSSPNQTRSAEEQPLTEIDFYHYKNGYAYVFATSILNASDESIDAIAADLEEIVASVSYE